MNTELVVASVSGAVALSSIVLSARFTRRQALLSAHLDQQTAEQERTAELQDAMSHRRDPLLWAAFDLQSRLYNIVRGPFLKVYYASGSDRERTYARRSTMHVVAEYLGQVELLRRRIQFLDLGNVEGNRTIVRHLMAIGNILNSDGFPDRNLRIFRSDQRAIGELMITADGERCLGYAEFCQRLNENADFAAWLEPLSESVEALTMGEPQHPRVIRLQIALMDLIDFLDPSAERFPDHRRSRLSLA